MINNFMQTYNMLKPIASLLLCCLLAGNSLIAQSADEKAVAGRVEALRKAMVAGDKHALGELTVEELSYGHSTGLVENKTAFIDEFLTGKSVFTSIDLTDQTISISGDVAIVRHHFKAETNHNKVPGKADIYVMMVWQKKAGQWKLLARQAVKVPPAQ
jgi:ketosteroid isomerase-like protein